MSVGYLGDQDSGTLSVKRTRFPGYAKPGDGWSKRKGLFLCTGIFNTGDAGSVLWTLFGCEVLIFDKK